jgi:two-component system phosphate regulon sensor histidine kinase PhoR
MEAVPPRAWRTESWRLGGLVLIAVLVGWIFGGMGWFLTLALLIYLARILVGLYRFERWLSTSKKYQPPSADGIWGGVAEHFYRLQRRNRKRKRKLASILNLFQESTQAMLDAAVVLNERKEIQWVNPAGERLLGVHVPQDAGQRIDNLIRSPEFVAYLAEGDGGKGIEIPSPEDPDAVLAIHMVGFAKNRFLLVARDVTERYRIDQVRRDFVANVSHELRTPLTVLSGFLEMMETSSGPCIEEWATPLGSMRRQVHRMERLVEDLLLLAKLESGAIEVEPEPVDVPEVVASVVEDARSLSAGRHRIELTVEPDLWLRGRQDELRTAFSNLVNNAVQYTDAGGQVQVRWHAPDGRGRFEVKDTGVGIPAYHLERLTERFYRIDKGRSREQGGTGLGLSIVKHVLDRHGAELEVRSEVEVGSAFACIFPQENTFKYELESGAAQALVQYPQ